MFLARKITQAKWRKRGDGLAEGEIGADAVTADLRTLQNSLSFWRCSSGDRAEIDGVALAIAAARDRIDKLDIVWIAEKDFESDGQALKETDGRTPAAAFRKRHVDLHRLDYVRLGKVAARVAEALEAERRKRFNAGDVKEILVAAVRGGEVEIDDLAEKIRERVATALSTR